MLSTGQAGSGGQSPVRDAAPVMVQKAEGSLAILHGLQTPQQSDQKGALPTPAH